LDQTATRINRTIATEIAAREEQVSAAVSLLDGGATVPFVARYRKEVTGGLDDTQLRTLADRLSYLREMEARRATILGSIRDQGKLTDDLARAIAQADTKAALEDIYLPYKPKRRTKAMIARENGLEPLLRAIQDNRTADPQKLAEAYTGENVETVKAALEGARDILAEELTENAALLGGLRDFMMREARISARVQPGKEEAGAKFSDYFDHVENWATIPSHRALAILRAAKEEIVTIEIAPDPETGTERAVNMVASAIGIPGDGVGDKWLRDAAGWTWRVKLSLSMYVDLLSELRRRAHEEAIAVFARNLKDLLLAAPAGNKATLGLDPGIRTGVKAAVVDATGKLLETATLYPFQPKMDLRGAQAKIVEMVKRHGVALIAIGNGTASRETEKLVADLLPLLPEPRPLKLVVSEAVTKTVEVPAGWRTRRIKEMVEPARGIRVEVPAEYRTERHEVLAQPGRVEVRAVLCETNATPALVVELQRNLKRAGFDPGPVDGVFGPGTAEALQAFQLRRGYAVGGVTQETAEALGVKLDRVASR